MTDRPSPQLWQPTRLVRVVESYDTSTGTTKVATDATFGYLKAMGNRQGPHVLAAELVASSLARWFGLTVPDFAVIRLPAEACFDLPRGARVEPGPAFVSRHVSGRTWGGSDTELRILENPSDITRLVVLDTWLRNCDRYPADLSARKPNYANVYLADMEKAGQAKLVAIDHTHCFDCGRDLSERLAHIDHVRDERTYGLFPAFAGFVTRSQVSWCGALLESLQRETVDGIIATVPAEWQVDERARTALASLVHGRAGFMADRIKAGWVPGVLDSPPV
jgi:hypothetical protein